MDRKESTLSSHGGAWASFLPGLPLLPNLPPLDPGVEQYRGLALKVESKCQDGQKRGKIIVTTAPDAGSGKTLTSLNLSIALSKKGEKRILLLECDIWKPTIRNFLKMSPEVPGLTDLLAREAQLDLQRAVVTIWSHNIDVITSDGRHPDADLLMGTGMRTLLKEMCETYDFIVCDAPPFFLAGGRFMVEIADKVLLVSRAKKTRRRDMERLLADVPQERFLGLVFNDVGGQWNKDYRNSSRSKYGGYGEYLDSRAGRPRGR